MRLHLKRRVGTCRAGVCRKIVDFGLIFPLTLCLVRESDLDGHTPIDPQTSNSTKAETWPRCTQRRVGTAIVPIAGPHAMTSLRKRPRLTILIDVGYRGCSPILLRPQQR